jgi:hypothetical protein
VPFAAAAAQLLNTNALRRFGPAGSLERTAKEACHLESRGAANKPGIKLLRQLKRLLTPGETFVSG